VLLAWLVARRTFGRGSQQLANGMARIRCLRIVAPSYVA
jgi:hypothetical protein